MWETRPFFLGIACVMVVSCSAGHVVVDYSVTAEGRYVDAPGPVGTLTTRAPPPRSLLPFESVEYSDALFAWSVGAGTEGIGGQLENRSASQLCFRFDQATIASNFHPQPVDLAVSYYAVFKDKWNVTPPRPGMPYVLRLPSLCTNPGEKVQVSFSADLKALYRTGKLFNVAWLDKQPQLTEKGIGNWIVVRLPLDAGGSTRLFELKVTAIDSRARRAYY